jgi:hypothetical protein
MKLDSRIDSAKFVSSNVISQNEKTFIQISQIDKTCVEHSENSLDGLLEIRGEDLNPLTKVLFKIVLIWTMGKSSTPTEGFSPGLINPGFKHPSGPLHESPQSSKRIRLTEIIQAKRIVIRIKNYQITLKQ